jgi:uncharacterized protein with HEPN domain
MRDVLAHQYFVADLDIVWQAVNEELPGLEAPVPSRVPSSQRA